MNDVDRFPFSLLHQLHRQTTPAFLQSFDGSVSRIGMVIQLRRKRSEGNTFLYSSIPGAPKPPQFSLLGVIR
jgi:hypothetical protein